MTTYKAVVELPPVELEVLNGMMNHVTPMTYENLKLIEEACEVSWAWQKFTEEHGYLDRMITAEFENGMIMDVHFWGEIGQTEGYYNGIQFGDKDNIFMYPNEREENCYPIAEGNEGMVDGIYAVCYNGDVYEMEIKPTR